ncbi:MAG: FAD:protein FMN transferase [Anaeromyxobacteraceae bacterium]
MRPALAAALWLASAAGPASAPAPAGAGLVQETRPTLGSLATVALAGVDPARAGPGLEAAFAVFERVTWSMNEWDPQSPLSSLNAAAGRGWVPLPGDLCDALARAKDGAARTDGRFDPTWAALSGLWRFDVHAPAPPAEPALRAACPLVGHAGLALRPRAAGGCDARLERAGMRVGLGGLAKGWALDAAARALRALGYRDFLLQAGGDLYAAGSRGGEPWTVGVRDPRGGAGDALLRLPVRDAAFSTSGDYEHAFVAGGRRYHHVLDPRTCRPAEGVRSVTVLAPSAVEAEIQGKSLFVAGPGAAQRLAREAGVEAIVVDSAGRVVATPGLAAASP